MIKSAITICLVDEARQGPFVYHEGLAKGCQDAAELGYDAVEIFAPAADAVDIDATKTLLENRVPSQKLVVVDETSSMGGLWNREKRPEVPCDAGVPSSSQPMYRDLKTNFPKDMTSFLGYPFPAEEEMFPLPLVVANYFQDFCVQTGVDQVTKLNTRVENCTKQDREGL